MVHNSHKLFEKDTTTRIYKLFFKLVGESHKVDDFLEIIADFISPSEQTMVAKRIAIVYLLIKGVSHSAISDYLGVSSATVAKYVLLFYQKETKSIILIRNFITQGKILGFLDDVFAEILIQPRLRKGHLKIYLNHQSRKDKRKMIDL